MIAIKGENALNKSVTKKPRKAGKPHKIRTKDGGEKEFSKLNRALAIKLLCMECLGWEGHPKDAVGGCTSPMCPVYPFRGRTEASLRGDEATGGAE